MPGRRLQAGDHFAQHGLEALDRYFLLVRVENLDETRHVGALEIMRQPDIHVEVGDGMTHAAALVQYLERMAYVLDADLVDR